MLRLLCLLDRHRPARRTARWDGATYAGTCERCGKPVKRLRKGVWVFDGDQEDDLHPA